MSDDADHQDGNALAGLLSGVFAADITTVVRRCAFCGDASPLGAHRLYRAAGLVLRCPSCSDVALRAVERDGSVSVTWAGVFEVPTPTASA
ncbi:MAG TPA: DUF6510 family protein [Solirubrobacteraceae bacterium]|nr:DUF6510 family protein [Solirubrobacteraceae bacterium]